MVQPSLCFCKLLSWRPDLWHKNVVAIGALERKEVRAGAVAKTGEIKAPKNFIAARSRREWLKRRTNKTKKGPLKNSGLEFREETPKKGEAAIACRNATMAHVRTLLQGRTGGSREKMCHLFGVLLTARPCPYRARHYQGRLRQTKTPGGMNRRVLSLQRMVRSSRAAPYADFLFLERITDRAPLARAARFCAKGGGVTRPVWLSALLLLACGAVGRNRNRAQAGFLAAAGRHIDFDPGQNLAQLVYGVV